MDAWPSTWTETLSHLWVELWDGHVLVILWRIIYVGASLIKQEWWHHLTNLLFSYSLASHLYISEKSIYLCVVTIVLQLLFFPTSTICIYIFAKILVGGICSMCVDFLILGPQTFKTHHAFMFWATPWKNTPLECFSSFHLWNIFPYGHLYYNL